jgi:L-ascorbate metabolism protein UlaG (beta-lactamase superfamily)
MNKLLIIIIVIAIGVVGFFLLNNYIYNEKQGETTMPPDSSIEVTPISHATMILKWGDKVIYTDPVGGIDVVSGRPEPDIILITDIHGDHFNLETVQALAKDKTTIIVPQVVAEKIANVVPGNAIVLDNGEVTNQQGFSIQAIPMYNLPESANAYHVKGRGNGYVVESGGQRVYISGDTADTPEMRNLQDIDIAFVTMNLPYTMSIESAASGVLAFKPKQVYPYHYRGMDGHSDVNKFKELVNAQDSSIEVKLLNWYP